MNLYARHSGRECRNPRAMDGNTSNMNAPEHFGILAVWMPLGRLPPTLDHAGMTPLWELE